MNDLKKGSGASSIKTRISIVMMADPDIIEQLDGACTADLEHQDRICIVKKILTDAKKKNESI